jgi:hypothetical protein
VRADCSGNSAAAEPAAQSEKGVDSLNGTPAAPFRRAPAAYFSRFAGIKADCRAGSGRVPFDSR